MRESSVIGDGVLPGCWSSSRRRGTRSRSRWSQLLLQICALSLVWLSCAKPREELQLEPLPTLDLETADPSARSQLTDKRLELERVLARPEAPAHDQAQAFSDLGLLYVAYDFLEAAEVCFRNALELDSTDFRWHYFLGYTELQQGRLESAIESLRRVIESQPDLLPAILRLGRAERELGRFSDARVWFERALEIDSESAAAHEGMGRAEIAEGRFESGIRHLERALEIDPAATGLNYALAQAHRSVGNLDRARSYLERSGDVATRVPDPLIDPLAMVAESTQFYLVQAAEAMEDEDFETAAGAFRAALEQDFSSRVAYRGLARCLVLIGDLLGAREVLEEVLEESAHGDHVAQTSDRVWILGALADLDLSSGQEVSALRRFDESLEISPDQPALLLRSANLLARLARFGEALERFDRLLALEPVWAATIRERRATVLVNLGRNQEAISEFELALKTSPEDLRLRYRFAEALAYMGDAAGARAQHEIMARLKGEGSDSLPVMVEEARRFTREGAYEDAIERFRTVLDAAPDHLDLRFELGSVLGESGRYAEAEVELERVIAAAPRHEAANRALVVSMILGERFGEARVKLQQVMRVFPRDVALALIQVRLLAASPDRPVRDGPLALEIASRVRRDHWDPPVQEAVALALAAAGRTDEARLVQEGLIASQQQGWSPALRELMAARLAAFQRGEAWFAGSAHEIAGGLSGST